MAELGRRVARHRLETKTTQATLAAEAGIAKRTLERIESGRGGQLSSFLRVLRALELVEGLEQLLPAPGPRPVDLLRLRGAERKRAPRSSMSRARGAPAETEEEAP